MASPGCSSLFSVLTPVRLSKIARTSNPAWKSQPIINIVGSCLSRHVLLFATRIGLSLRSQRRYVIKRGRREQSPSESKDLRSFYGLSSIRVIRVHPRFVFRFLTFLSRQPLST